MQYHQQTHCWIQRYDMDVSFIVAVHWSNWSSSKRFRHLAAHQVLYINWYINWSAGKCGFHDHYVEVQLWRTCNSSFVDFFVVTLKFICVFRNHWYLGRSLSTTRRMKTLQIAKFLRPTWDPPGSCCPQMGPKLAPWTLLSGTLPAMVSA